MKIDDLEKQIISISASNTEDENMMNIDHEHSNCRKIDKQFLSAEDSDLSFNDKPANITNKSKPNANLVYSKYDVKPVKKKESNIKSSDPLSQQQNQKKQKEREDKYLIQITKLTTELQEAKKLTLELKQDKLSLQEENGYIRLEKEKLSKIKDTELSIVNEKLSNLEIQNKKLASINDSNSKKIEEYTPKVWKYDELYEKYEKATKDNEKLFDNNSSMNNLLATLKRESSEMSTKYDTLKLENESLKQDRMFLNKTSMGQDEKIKTANEKVKQLEEDIREMRKINQTYIDKLTDKNINLDLTYKDKVNSELTSMKIKYEKDIETLKKNYDEITEKKTQYLTEERDDYKAKALRYEKSIKEKEEAMEFISNELRSLNKKTDEESSYLKLQVNIKTEELTRIKNLYEENLSCLSLLKNENDLLKEKNDILRSELIKKDSDYRTAISELKAQLSVTKEKLSNYDQMENELDKVICDSTVLANDDKSNEVISIIKDIPTSSKRRISQCLVLANKIKLMTVETEQLKDMNKNLQCELNATRDERELYRSVTDKAKQPYAYLLKNLQDNELELYRLKQEDAEKEQRIQRLIKENDLLEERAKGLESDLKAIVNNRQKLNNLENVITSFIQNEKNATGSFENSGMNYSNENMNSSNIGQIMKNANVSMTNSMMNNPGMTINQGYTNNSFGQSQQRPERDNDINTNIMSGSSVKVPSWYMKLKSKK